MIKYMLYRPDGSTPVDFPPCLTMQEGEIVYDYTWFPLMDSTRPDLCCFAVTAQYQPIHLYDAFDGHLRASYRYISGSCISVK